MSGQITVDIIKCTKIHFRMLPSQLGRIGVVVGGWLGSEGNGAYTKTCFSAGQAVYIHLVVISICLMSNNVN